MMKRDPEANQAPILPKEPDHEPPPDKRQKSKPGPKSGRAYGTGIAAKGGNKRQLTLTFSPQVLDAVNEVSELTGTPRTMVVQMALQWFFASDHPVYGHAAIKALKAVKKKPRK